MYNVKYRNKIYYLILKWNKEKEKKEKKLSPKNWGIIRREKPKVSQLLEHRIKYHPLDVCTLALQDVFHQEYDR